MTANDYLLRYGSVNSKSFLPAIKHNRRETQKEYGTKAYIDVTRTQHNYSLHGLETACKIERYAKSLIMLAGIAKVRKNAVWAVEIIFSLPIDWHDKDSRPYFENCYQWTLTSFEGELLSFDVHLDESAPHAHALIFPLIDCKMQGDKLKGDRKKIYDRYHLFYEMVAVHYGFKLPTKQRFNLEDKTLLAREVLKLLSGDSIQNSAVFACIRDTIFANPIPFAQLLGIALSPTKSTPAKSFVDIKRSKGHGSFIR